MPPKFSKELSYPVSFETRTPREQPRTSPCEAGCPAGHAIQRTIYFIQDNRFEEALENVRAKNPFPGTCGRACFHPCEAPCNRTFFDQGLAIRALERAAFDLADREKVRRPKCRPKIGKRVAVVGSGPAGMTAAYFLTLFGHDVTVFEALPFPGGMPRFGIPDYRLPKDIPDREIEDIIVMGVKVRTHTAVGRDISFKEIMEAHDACLIATGAWREKRLDIPGKDLAVSGLDLLLRAKEGEKPMIGKKVLILGGGGVAFDYAGTARRLGADEVHIACLEPRDKMVAPEEDVRQGEQEGVILHNSKIFLRILGDGGRVTGVECQDVRAFKFSQDGRLEVKAVPGSEEILPADTVIFAVGEEPDLDFLDGAGDFRLTERGTLDVDMDTFATSVPGIFAAGDAATGPRSIAEAVGTGRKAAVSIDCYFSGKDPREIESIYFDQDGEIRTREVGKGSKGAKPAHVVCYEEIMNPDYYEKMNRVGTACLDPSEAVSGFQEINKGYDREEAVKEAGRCFHCGHCAMCGTCVDICPMDVLAMGEDGPTVAYPKECWHCGGCRINCPCGAVYYEFPLSMLI
ncbi:MAG: FAD-dependent oxidoreductase [Deltaproteobacteria bacterium]|nr:FAD-dependent oxidoreductase [Deltaproteobacteria bacterium]